MRIAFVVHKFPPESLGGTEIYTHDLAEALGRRHQVWVFYPLESEGQGDDILHRDGLHLWRVRVDPRRWERHPLAVFFSTFRSREIEAGFGRFLEQVCPELVHFQHVQGVSAALIPMARSRGLPTLMTLHDYWYFCANSQLLRPGGETCMGPRWGLNCVDCAAVRANLAFLKALRSLVAPLFMYRNAVLRRVLKNIQLFLAPSHFLMQRYLAWGLPVERLRYLENGINLTRIQSLPWQFSPDGKVRFTYLGALAWQKGVHVLIEAFNALRKEVAELHIFGDPRVFPDYAARLKRLARHPGIRFRGPLEPHRVGEALAGSNVVVVPSLWFENSPLVIQEAFAAGAPVIASGQGALVEKVRDGVDGLLFRPGDAADLRAKIEQLMAEPSLLETLRRNILPVKTMKEHAQELEAIYSGLVK